MVRNLLTVAFLSLICLVWCWPLVSDPPDWVLSRQFDHLGTLWVSGVGPRLDSGVVTLLLGWPLGQDLLPGIAATALLEGHPYVLLTPWLPLMAWQWHRASSPGGRYLHGLLAGAMWVLCLLTSAYTGIVATLWVIVTGGRALARRDPCWGPFVLALLVMLVAGGAYALAFISGGEGKPADAFYMLPLTGAMLSGSTTLATLAGVPASVDLDAHSIVPAPGFLTLLLPLFAWRLRLGAGPWRVCLLLGALGLVLALGPSLRGYVGKGGLPWILAPLAGIEAASFFRFPVLMMWLAGMGLGAVAALSASALGRRSRWALLLLLPLALLDIFRATGMPGRTARIPFEVPTAYRAIPQRGALLPLVLALNGTARTHETYLTTLDCAFQHVHRRPLVSRCLGGVHRGGPRWEIGSWLRSALMGKQDQRQIRSTLACLGVGSVVLRPDLFLAGDRKRIRGQLALALGPPVASSRDNGDHLKVHAGVGP